MRAFLLLLLPLTALSQTPFERDVDAAIERGLDHFRGNQGQAGDGWDRITGLVTLAFLEKRAGARFDAPRQGFQSRPSEPGAESFRAGQVIANQGDASADMFILLSGVVQIHRGAELVDTVDEPGQFLGLFSYFSGGERNATMTVLHDAELFRVRPQGIEKLLNSAPTLALRMVADTTWVFLERESSHAELKAARAPDALAASSLSTRGSPRRSSAPCSTLWR